MSTIAWVQSTVAPTQPPTVDPQKISPGMAGAIVTFILALALIVLVRSMVGHLRKVRYSPEPGVAETAGPGTVADPKPVAGQKRPAARERPRDGASDGR